MTPEDPWQWLHDNGFPWDDVNAMAAIVDAGGYSLVPTADLDQLRAAPLGIGRLKAALVQAFPLRVDPHIIEDIVREYAALGDRAAEEGPETLKDAYDLAVASANPEKARTIAARMHALGDRAAEPCPSCNGTRYVDDENWQSDYPGQKREWHAGRIPCGACNEGGWDEPDGGDRPAEEGRPAIEAEWTSAEDDERRAADAER